MQKKVFFLVLRCSLFLVKSPFEPTTQTIADALGVSKCVIDRCNVMRIDYGRDLEVVYDIILRLLLLLLATHHYHPTTHYDCY